MPAITVDTAGCERQKRSAIAGNLLDGHARVGGDRLDAVPDLLLAVRRRSTLLRKSPGGNSVSGRMRPVSAPSSNGTRTITPTFAASTAGKSSSSGLWSKTL